MHFKQSERYPLFSHKVLSYFCIKLKKKHKIYQYMRILNEKRGLNVLRWLNNKINYKHLSSCIESF